MYRPICYALLGLFLTACADNAINQTSFPVASVFAADYSKQMDVTLYYDMGSAILSMRNINTPKQDTSFENKNVKSAEIRSIFKKDNAVISDSIGTTYFQESTFKYVGYKDENEYEVVTQHSEIPKTAMIDESGDMNKTISYADASKKTQVGDTIRTWSLTKANDHTAWLCEEFEIYYTAEDKTDSEAAFCTEINVEGEVIDHKISLKTPTVEGTQTIVFTSR